MRLSAAARAAIETALGDALGREPVRDEALAAQMIVLQALAKKAGPPARALPHLVRPAAPRRRLRVWRDRFGRADPWFGAEIPAGAPHSPELAYRRARPRGPWWLVLVLPPVAAAFSGVAFVLMHWLVAL